MQVRQYTIRSSRSDAEAGWIEDPETGELTPTSPFIRAVQSAIGTEVTARDTVFVHFNLTANTILTKSISPADFNSRRSNRGVLVSRAFDLATKNIIWGRVTDFSCSVHVVTDEAPCRPAVTRFERPEVL